MPLFKKGAYLKKNFAPREQCRKRLIAR